MISVLFACLMCGECEVEQCPGVVNVSGGLGTVHIVATQINMLNFSAGPVKNVGGNVIPEMWGRAYFAQECTNGKYNNSDYLALPLLGKKLTYTTELSQAGCGCNAALYLVSMQQNTEVSDCMDYYCDANSVCGVNCHEIDIQEANRYAWHSALHKEHDGNGISQGYGGWVVSGAYPWNSTDYGPGGRCIDTDRPFQVSAAFPKSAEGRLRALEMGLSQGGPCNLTYSMSEYAADPGFEHLSRALEDGMTPVLSYWKSQDMLWLDGPGNGGGPCREDTQLCGVGPQFYGFAVEDL